MSQTQKKRPPRRAKTPLTKSSWKKGCSILLSIILLLSMIGCQRKVVSSQRTEATAPLAASDTTASPKTAPQTEEQQNSAQATGKAATQTATQTATKDATGKAATQAATQTATKDEAGKAATQAATQTATKDEAGKAATKAASKDRVLSEEGTYTSKEEVARYLHQYKHLPSNFITKKEAIDLGWESSKGNLNQVAPGKSIGGDRFGNREGLLPDKKGRIWKECDIGYKGGHREAERIVFSNDGEIYYSKDHYKNFELLYSAEK